MHYCLDGKDATLKAGETVVIPPDVPHTFWCDGKDGQDMEVLITVRGGPNPGAGKHPMYVILARSFQLLC